MKITRQPEYPCWTAMKQRCFNPKNPQYADYGGRGITVCDRWRTSFAAFLADMERRPSPKHSIDRINNDGNYEPGNCRWATAKQQIENRRQPRYQTVYGQMARIFHRERGGVAWAAKVVGLSPRSVSKWLRCPAVVRPDADRRLRAAAACIVETEGLCVPAHSADRARRLRDGVILLSVAINVVKSDHRVVARLIKRVDGAFGITPEFVLAVLDGREANYYIEGEIRRAALRMLSRRLGAEFVRSACRAEAERLLKGDHVARPALASLLAEAEA